MPTRHCTSYAVCYLHQMIRKRKQRSFTSFLNALVSRCSADRGLHLKEQELCISKLRFMPAYSSHKQKTLVAHVA